MRSEDSGGPVRSSSRVRPVLVPLGLTPLIGLCLQCQIDNPNTHQKAKRVPNPECLLGGDCCAVAILSAQEDFKSTRSRLQEIVEEAGHIFLPHPKFHCELNWIEYYWGRCKYFTRKHCNYTLAGTVALQAPHWLMVFMLTAGIRTTGGCSPGS